MVRATAIASRPQRAVLQRPNREALETEDKEDDTVKRGMIACKKTVNPTHHIIASLTNHGKFPMPKRTKDNLNAVNNGAKL
jgi:hypothetical protein